MREKLNIKTIILFILFAMCTHLGSDALVANIKKKRQLTWSDAEGYYMYLPGVFIFKNFKDIPVKTPQFKRVEKTGNFYSKYTYGTAFMQFPFFFVADLVAKNSKHARNGYSRPYQVSIFIAAFTYVILGLILLFKILARSYEKFIVWLVLLSIFYGTNLMHYCTMEAGMSHAFSFFLICCLLYLTPKFYKEKTFKASFLIAITISLIVLTRPTNVLAALYILFYKVNSKDAFIERAVEIKSRFFEYAFMLFPFIILFFVQAQLWGQMLGETVLYSYNSEPKFIYWKKPKIFKVLFDVQNGLFVYAPILLFALHGIFEGYRQKKYNIGLIAIILMLATYTFASWWAWWFGGAYGHRCYVDFLPFFAILLAISYKKLFATTNKFIISGLSLVIGFFLFYSVSMTMRYRSPWDGPDWDWNSWYEIFKTIFG